MKGLIFTIISLVVILIIGGIISSSNKHEDPQETKRYMAIVMAEKFMSQRLKSPATAKYESDPAVSQDDENIFTVTSYVDSQNSFGAMLRTNFIAKVKYLYDAGDQQRWQLISITEN